MDPEKINNFCKIVREINQLNDLIYSPQDDEGIEIAKNQLDCLYIMFSEALNELTSKTK